MLAEKYDMIFCGENYTSDISDKIADPAYQKDLCYIPNLKDFRDDEVMKNYREGLALINSKNIMMS